MTFPSMSALSFLKLLVFSLQKGTLNKTMNGTQMRCPNCSTFFNFDKSLKQPDMIRNTTFGVLVSDVQNSGMTVTNCGKGSRISHMPFLSHDHSSAFRN